MRARELIAEGLRELIAEGLRQSFSPCKVDELSDRAARRIVKGKEREA